MIDSVSFWINALFIATTCLCILIFHYINNRPKKLTLFIIGWSVIHSVLAYIGFYQNTDTIPPRFGLVLIPATLLIIYGLLKKQRQWILQNRNLKTSPFLHIVRIPVEIVLYYLFLHKTIPELMTFAGRNFDILAGITAPIFDFLFIKNIISKNVMIFWNIISLCLVLFILINGILSAELPFQQFAFDQPNRAIAFFPYILLPATVVPLVVYTHLTDIYKLGKGG